MGEEGETAAAAVSPADKELRALVIDDAFAYEEGASWWDEEERWNLFMRRLQAGPSPALSDVEAAGIEEIGDRADAFAAIREQVGGAMADAVMREATGDRPMVETWVEQLRSLGWTVVTASGVDEVVRKAPDGELPSFVRDFQLVLLDYELVIGDEGRASQAFAERLGEIALDPATERPPQLIKFSRHEIEGVEAERLQFAVRVRYPRGCYEFMAKSLAANAATFPAILSGVLAAGVIGQRLFGAARAIRRTLERDVDANMTEMLLLKVDPTGLRVMFRDKLAAEGMSELDYLIETVTNRLAQRIRSSHEVAADVTAFVDSLGEPQPGQPAETLGLSELEIGLVSDSSATEFRRPIDFGDVFRFGSDTVGILVTPQCDLMVRGDGRVATDVVTIRLGRQHPDHTWTPRFIDAGDGSAWSIEWLPQLAVIPRLLLDICSLRSDGRARIEQDEQTFRYWTKSFSAFAARQLEAAGALTRTQGKRRLLIVSASGSDGRGLSLNHEFEVDDQGFIQVQRLCRLRYADTLALLQQSLADAARIGLMPALDARVEHASVEVLDSDGVKLPGDLNARVTYVGGDASARRYVDVETPALRAILGSRAEWSRLVEATSGRESRFDLESGAKANQFRLESTGKPPVFRLRLPKPIPADRSGPDAAGRRP